MYKVEKDWGFIDTYVVTVSMDKGNWRPYQLLQVFDSEHEADEHMRDCCPKMRKMDVKEFDRICNNFAACPVIP